MCTIQATYNWEVIEQGADKPAGPSIATAHLVRQIGCTGPAGWNVIVTATVNGQPMKDAMGRLKMRFFKPENGMLPDEAVAREFFAQHK